MTKSLCFSGVYKSTSKETPIKISNSVTTPTTTYLNCIFEETSGCMFRHEIAPVCKDSDKCKFKQCQYSHAVNEERSDESNIEAKEVFSDEEKKCGKCEYCNEIVDHTQHNLQECSKCDFNSKYWAVYNIHWQKTPDHIFSIDELR